MNQKELRELITFLIEKDIAEFELDRGDFKVRVKRGSAAIVAVPAERRRPDAVPAAPLAAQMAGPAAESAAAKPPVEAEELHVVKSPIVGTFYESPSPGSPPFVKAGDVVELGAIVGIIEAMKLMNEIECDVAGEVVKRLVANGQPVEYGQPLFSIRPLK